MKKLNKNNSIVLYKLYVWLIKSIMRNGNLRKAYSLLNFSLFLLRSQYKIEIPLVFIFFALENIAPKLKFLKKKVAGRKVLIPTFLLENQGLLQAIRFLISISKRVGKPFAYVFSSQIVDAYRKIGKPHLWALSINKLGIESRPNLRFIK